ncbi:MAG: ferredoxin [Actinobacteria bacterium]|nr:ferredoxin [Actinomycetota bacterium]
MRIVVDRGLCEANAVCEGIATEVFHVTDDDVLELLDETPPEAMRERLEAAVLRCPRRALSIVD